jgi:putative membrane protein
MVAVEAPGTNLTRAPDEAAQRSAPRPDAAVPEEAAPRSRQRPHPAAQEAARARAEVGAKQGAERTMLMWVRTGISLMVFGFLVARYAGTVHRGLPSPDVSVRYGTVVGLVIIAAGGVLNAFAARRYVLTHRAITRGESVQPGIMGPTVVAVATIALGAVVALMVLYAYLARAD